MIFRRILAALAVIAITCGELYGEDRSVVLTYPSGYRGVDMSNSQNVKALNQVASIINLAKEEGKSVRIVCTGYSSPGSDNPITRNIGESRQEALADLFEEKGLLGRHRMEYEFGGIGWEVLKQEVKESDIPYKDEILQILSKPDEVVLSNVHDNQTLIVEGLKKINDGKVWNEIKYTVIPVIRNTLYITTSGGEKFSLRYQTGYYKVNMNYDGNERKVNRIVSALKNGETVVIAYSPNPGGDNDIYKNIAERRAKELSELLLSESKSNRSKISFGKSNDGWYDLRNLIESSEESWSREALDVIDNYRTHLLTSNKSANDVKIKLLKKLDGGKIYERMKTRMFPIINNILVVKVIVD